MDENTEISAASTRRGPFWLGVLASLALGAAIGGLLGAMTLSLITGLIFGGVVALIGILATWRVRRNPGVPYGESEAPERQNAGPYGPMGQPGTIGIGAATMGPIGGAGGVGSGGGGGNP